MSNNDLSDPLQGLCAVRIKFKHDFVGDLTFRLSSPFGHSIDLIGPVGVFGESFLSSWDVMFLPCSAPVSPDPGFESVWSNEQLWGLFGNFNGSYYPQMGCLESFDTGPVNGIWTLSVLDEQQFGEGIIESFYLVFCDQDGDCQQCNANAGTFITSDTLSYCMGGGQQMLDLEPEYSSTGQDTSLYNYIYAYALRDTFTGIVDSMDLSTFQPGEYSVYAFSYLKDQGINIDEYLLGKSIDSVLNEINRPNPAFCLASSSNSLVIQILETPELNIADVHLDNCLDSILMIAEPRVSAFDYTWTLPDGHQISGDSIKLFSPGEHSLVANNKGCLDTALFLVDVQGLIPSLNIDGIDSLSCNQDSDTLRLSTNILNPKITWTGINGVASMAEELIVAEGGTYTARIDFLDNCTIIDSIEIGPRLESPPFTITTDTADCNSPLVNMQLNADQSFTAFQWSGPEQFESLDSQIVVQTEGWYSIELLYDMNCKVKDSLYASFNLEIPVIDSIGEFLLTCKDQEIEIGVFVRGDSLQYNWNGPAGFVSEEAFPLVRNPGMYALQIANNHGCVIEEQIEVLQDTIQPKIFFEPFLPIQCERDKIWLNSNIEVTGDVLATIWTTSTGIILFGGTGFSILVGSEGIYHLETRDLSNGCSAFDSIIVEELPSDLEILNMDVAHESCVGEKDGSAVISAFEGSNSPFTVSYMDNIYAIEDTIQGLEPGNHLISLIDTNGCRIDSLITIEKAEEFKIDLLLEQPNMSGGEVVVQAIFQGDHSESVDLVWDTGVTPFFQEENSIRLTPTDNIEISVSAVSQEGCMSADTLLISVEKIETIYIPNVFSIGSESENNRFVAFPGNGISEIESFRIYDRWGELLYSEQHISSDEQMLGWDGKFNGEVLQPSVYVYLINIVLNSGEKKQYAGNVTLLR